MSIDKERLVKNLIIFAILAVVCMVFLRMTGSADDFGTMIIAGLTIACVLYFPIRMYPRVGLLGSFIILIVMGFLLVGFSNLMTGLLGATLGSIVGLLLLLATFIASLIFL